MNKGVFRGIGPVALKAGAAVGGGALSLASEAADSEDMGGQLEDEAFQRESDEANRRKKALAAEPQMSKVYENIETPHNIQDKVGALLKLKNGG
jgi:hypothetical protein